jgi:hypothetical protein
LVEGHVEGAKVFLATRPPSAIAVDIVITATVDGDRMRARIEVPSGQTYTVRLQRCRPEEKAQQAATGSEAFCTVEAVWQRLSAEHGVPIRARR